MSFTSVIAYSVDSRSTKIHSTLLDTQPASNFALKKLQQ